MFPWSGQDPTDFCKKNRKTGSHNFPLLMSNLGKKNLHLSAFVFPLAESEWGVLAKNRRI